MPAHYRAEDAKITLAQATIDLLQQFIADDELSPAYHAAGRCPGGPEGNIMKSPQANQPPSTATPLGRLAVVAALLKAFAAGTGCPAVIAGVLARHIEGAITEITSTLPTNHYHPGSGRERRK